MKTIVSTRAGVLAVLATVAAVATGTAFATGLLPLTPQIAGRWIFQTEGTSTYGMPYDDWEIQVWQDGYTFYGNKRPEPMVKNGVISGKNVLFSIILEADDDNGCGDFSELSGTLSGNTISGTIVGHDCAYFSVWEGTFTVNILK